MLTELALEGQVEIDERTTLRGREVHAVIGDPPADPLLRTTWERLAERSTDVGALILEIGPTLRQSMIDRVVERGHIRREKRRFLGMIPTTSLVDGGTARRDELLDAVRPVLIDGADPDLRAGALAALLSASDALPTLDPDIPWSGAVYTRGKELQRGDWGPAAAGAAVAQTTATILSNSLFVTVTLPALRGE